MVPFQLPPPPILAHASTTQPRNASHIITSRQSPSKHTPARPEIHNGKEEQRLDRCVIQFSQFQSPIQKRHGMLYMLACLAYPAQLPSILSPSASSTQGILCPSSSHLPHPTIYARVHRPGIPHSSHHSPKPLLPSHRQAVPTPIPETTPPNKPPPSHHPHHHYPPPDPPDPSPPSAPSTSASYSPPWHSSQPGPAQQQRQQPHQARPSS